MSTAFDCGNRLVVALDVADRDAANKLLDSLRGVANWIKIGLELFAAEGPDLVREYAARGHRVMLDLKLHDIPATVARATARIAGLGAELLTVHTAGGAAMLAAAVTAARAESRSPRPLRLLGVTVLTSLEEADLAEVGIGESMTAAVLARAKLAHRCSLDGVVASPHELAQLRAQVPAPFLLVAPGVRPGGAPAGDQRRVATPGEARRAGADLVVVGRPIRDADDPGEAARRIAAELV